MKDDPRRMIVRLAVAVMAADGRITLSEIAAANELDKIGLGPLSTLASEEIDRAATEPIDIAATCAVLSEVSSQGGRIIVAILAGIAAADGVVSAREREVIRQIAAHLGLSPDAADEALALSATSIPQAPTIAPAPALASEPENGLPESARGLERPTSPAVSQSVTQAYAILGLRPGATGKDVEIAYRAALERYDPKKGIDLGPEFAVLAVRKLTQATAAFEVALDASRRAAA